MLSLSDTLARLREVSDLDAAAVLDLRRAIFMDGSVCRRPRPRP